MDEFNPDEYIANFNPDAYLSSRQPAEQAAPEFDPDAYIAKFNPDAYLAGRKEAEGVPATFAREAANAVVPAATGVLGAGAVGALAGTAFGPVGSFVGGVGGMIAGAYAGNKLQDVALKAAGIDQDEQRALNAEKNPVSSFAGGMAPFIGSPVLAAEKGAGLLGQVTGNALKQRAAGGAMMGGFEAVQQGFNGDIDPAHIAGAAAFGAAMPTGNAATRALHTLGAKGFTPEAQDAARSQSPNVAGNNALAQQPAADNKAAIGQENSKAAGPEDYRKKPAVNAEDTVLGEGGFSQGGVTDNKTTMSALAPEQVPVNTGIEEAGRPVQPAAPDLIQNQREELERVLQRTDLGPAARKQLEARLAKFGGPTEKPQAALLPEESAEAQLAPAEPEYTPQQQAERLARIEAKKKPQATLPVLPPIPEGHTRLLRVNSELIGPKKPLPEWLREAPQFKSAEDAAGRWFAADQDNIKWYQDFARKNGETSRLTYVDLPTTEAEKYRVSNLNDATAKAHSRRPEEEFFVPHEVADKQAELSAPKAEEPAAEVPDATRIRRMRAAGMNKLADMYEQMPVEQRAKLGDVIDRQLPQTTKHGVDRRASDNARLVNKLGNEAKTKPLREQHDSAIDAIQKAYDTHPPKEVETAEQLVARLRAAVDTAHGAHGYNPLNPAKGYHPRVMPETFQWYKKVQELADRRPVYWTANKIAEFKAEEKLLRKEPGREVAIAEEGGPTKLYKPESIDAGIAKSRRGGDVAEKVLEREAVNPEDEIIAALDAERSGKNVEEAVLAAREGKPFDKIDTEEQELSGPTTKTPIKSRATLLAAEKPRATLDLTKPEDEAKLAATLEKGQKAKKLKDEIAARAEIAMKENGKKRSGLSVSAEEAEKLGTKLTKGGDISAAERARIMKEAEASQARAQSRDAPKKLYVGNEKYPDIVKDMTGAVIRFGGDEAGALNVGKIGKDLKGLKDWAQHFHASAKAITLKDLHEPQPVGSSRVKAHAGAEGKPGKEYPQAADMVGKDTETVSNWLQAGIQGDKIDKAQWIKVGDQLVKASRGKTQWDNLTDSVRMMFGKKPTPDKGNGFMNERTMEDLYLAHEEQKIDLLHDEALKDFYKDNGVPVMEENGQLKALIDHLAPGKLGRTVLNHIYRIAKGENFKDAGGGAYDPVSGTNALSTRARDTGLERTFVALERVDGSKKPTRFVISLPKDGEKVDHQFTLWDKRHGVNVKQPGFEFKDGETIEVKGVKYKMTDALTREIEANALNEKGQPMVYRKNFMESAIRANVYLRSLARHLQLLEKIRNSEEFRAYATKDYDTAKENGWEKSKTTLPGFEDFYMRPEIREVLDDFQQPGFNEESLTKLRNVSRAVTKTIFWLPTAHAFNVGVHWFVGRGWDWLTPSGYKSLAQDGTKAMRMVIDQTDPFMRRLADNGWGGVYAGILGQDFGPTLARRLGEHIEREPSKWGPVADTLDMTVGDLARSVYDASSKGMWSANDMFLTQSILENLRKVGVDEKSATDLQIQQAIKRAERHIPNYRMPSRVISSSEWGRTLAKALGDPLAFVFGRYHIGVYNSLAHIVKGITKGSGPERFEAIGHLMAMGALAYAIKPAVDKLWQTITGNEDAEARGRGPLGPVGHVKKMVETGDPSPLIRSTATMSPLGSVVMDVLGDFTGFGDKRIVNRGDLKDAVHGDIKAMGKVGAQGAGFLAGNLVAPVGTLNSTLGKDQSVLGGLRDQALDIDNPSDRSVAFKGKIDRLNAKETIKREKRPPTIFEKLYN